MARFRKLISNISPSRGSIATPRRSAALLGGSDLDDTLFGTTASDTLQGLGGNDTLYGDAGSDTLEGSTGADTLYGGTGIDFVSFATATAGVGVNLGFATGGGSGFGGDAVGDVYEGIEAIIGSPFGMGLGIAALS